MITQKSNKIPVSSCSNSSEEAKEVLVAATVEALEDNGEGCSKISGS